MKRLKNNQKHYFSHKNSRKSLHTIANQRIRQLFSIAEKSKEAEPHFVVKYVKLAHKIASRSRTRLPRSLRRKICPHCFNILQPGVNCLIRTRASSQPRIIRHCHNCGKISRIPYK